MYCRKKNPFLRLQTQAAAKNVEKKTHRVLKINGLLV